MARYSQAHNIAAQKYIKKSYDAITFRMRKDSDLNKDTLQELAVTSGESVNEYITKAILQRAEAEKALKHPGL